MHGKFYAGESIRNIGGNDPVGGIFRVIIIAVNGQTVSTDEICSAAVAVLVLGAHIVAFNCFCQRGFVRDIYLVRI